MFSYSTRVFALISIAQTDVSFSPSLCFLTTSADPLNDTYHFPVDLATLTLMPVSVPFCCLIVTPQDTAPVIPHLHHFGQLASNYPPATAGQPTKYTPTTCFATLSTRAIKPFAGSQNGSVKKTTTAPGGEQIKWRSPSGQKVTSER